MELSRVVAGLSNAAMLNDSMLSESLRAYSEAQAAKSLFQKGAAAYN